MTERDANQLAADVRRLRSDVQHGINSVRLPDCYAASVALDALT